MPMIPTQGAARGPQGYSFVGQQIDTSSVQGTIISSFVIEEDGETQWRLTCDDPKYQFPTVFSGNPINLTVSAAGSGNLTGGPKTVNITIQDLAGSPPVTVAFNFDISTSSSSPSGIIQSPSSISIKANDDTSVVLATLTTIGGSGPTFTYSVDNANLQCVGNELKPAPGAVFTRNTSVLYKLTTTDTGTGLSYTDPSNRTAHVLSGPQAITFVPASPSVPDSITAGSLVCTGSVTGELSLPINAVDLNGDVKFTVSTSGSAVSIYRSSSGTLVDGTPESLSIQVTDAAGLTLAAPQALTVAVEAASFVTTFVIKNDGASSSRVLKRIGLPFKKGDIPAGSVPVITGGVAPYYQFDERCTWSDGSLAFAVCHIGDTDLASGASRTYTVSAAAGSYDNTGIYTTSDVTNAHDFNIEFTETTYSDGATLTQYGSGNFASHFSDLASWQISGVNTRIWKIHSGPACEGWYGWIMVKDTGTTNYDTWLKVYWHVDIWKNADGSIAYMEHAAEPALDFYPQAQAWLLSYVATYNDGANAIATYNTNASLTPLSANHVEHPYKSRWLTCRTFNDNWRGLRQWADGTDSRQANCPTLTYMPDRSYWISTGFVPSINLNNARVNLSAVAVAPTTYIPCSTEGQRSFVDGTGSYQGRGMISNFDCIAFQNQDPGDYMQDRLSAFAGLHIPYHYRSPATRTRPQDSGVSDIASSVIPLKLPPQSPLPQWTSDGLPTAVDAYSGSTSATYKYSYVKPLGQIGSYSGAWYPSSGSSHGCVYSFYNYLHEGERYMLEAEIDLATKQNYAASDGYNQNYMYYSVPYYKTSLGIPNTLYSGVSQTIGSNIRKLGWCLNLWGTAYAITPDTHEAKGYVGAQVDQVATYTKQNLNYMIPSQKTAGWVRDSGEGGEYNVVSPWMHNFILMGMCTVVNLCEKADMLTAAQQLANIVPNLVNYYIYQSEAYRLITFPNAADFADDTTNAFFPPGEGRWRNGVISIVASTGVCTLTGNVIGMAMRNGDKISTQYDPATSNPTNLVAGQTYYVGNVSGSGVGQTFKVYEDAGLTILHAFSADGTNVQIGYTAAMAGDYTVWSNPPKGILADDYAPICRAAAVYANRLGLAAVDGATVSKIQNFLTGIDNSDWATWDLTI